MVERSHFLSQQPLDVLRFALQASDVFKEMLNLAFDHFYGYVRTALRRFASIGVEQSDGSRDLNPQAVFENTYEACRLPVVVKVHELLGRCASIQGCSISGTSCVCQASTKRVSKSAMSARSSVANTQPVRALNWDLACTTSRPTLASLSTTLRTSAIAAVSMC